MSDFTADVRYRPTHEGGRIKPVSSGYRGQFFYDGWDAVHEFYTQEPLLGNTVQSDISVTNAEAHAGKLFVGMLFQVREGRRIVADGMITSIKTKALER